MERLTQLPCFKTEIYTHGELELAANSAIQTPQAFQLMKTVTLTSQYQDVSQLSSSTNSFMPRAVMFILWFLLKVERSTASEEDHVGSSVLGISCKCHLTLIDVRSCPYPKKKNRESLRLYNYAASVRRFSLHGSFQRGLCFCMGRGEFRLVRS